jgi:ribosomal-protein-alanine acetyltransferase
MNSPSAAISIRRMTEADVDPVMELAAGVEHAPQWPRSAYLKALAPGATPRRMALVAEEAGSGEVVGFAVVGLLESMAELETMAVASERRRQGLARRLFFALAAESGQAGAREFILEVRNSNHPALGLYRSLGFAETGRRPRYYHDPVEDAVLMSLPLTAPTL